MRATKEQIRTLWASLDAIISPGSGETTLIIHDSATQEVHETFRAALALGGVDASAFELPDDRPLTDIPVELMNMLDELKPTLCFNQLYGYAEETPFRIALFHRQVELGARAGHSPDVTMDMVLGPMLSDVGRMRELGRRLMDAMRGATEMEVTSPGGTNATFSISGRKPQWDLEIAAGEMGNLPAGECWWAPVEESMNGVLVIDGSIGDLKKLYPPLTVEVKDGRVTGMECEDPSLTEILQDLLHVDDQSDLLGELGIGLNPGAKITGLLLEDEKALNTLHFAFGQNTDMHGGCNSSMTHRDFIIRQPNLKRTDTGEFVMKLGEIL